MVTKGSFFYIKSTLKINQYTLCVWYKDNGSTYTFSYRNSQIHPTIKGVAIGKNPIRYGEQKKSVLCAFGCCGKPSLVR